MAADHKVVAEKEAVTVRSWLTVRLKGLVVPLASPPHPSNEGYAYAKRMCEVQCRLYNEQYGTDYVCVVPTNLYGPNDSYPEQSSHVVAALIRRAHEVA